MGIGDTVLHYSGGFNSIGKPATITELTATLIKTTAGTFKRRNGQSKGCSYGSISAASPEEFEQAANDLAQRQFARRFNEMDWRKVPVETLRQVSDMLGNLPTP